MKTTIQKPVVAILAFLFTALFGSAVLADSHAPPPPGVVETFSCTFNADKDMDDLMAARDFYAKTAKKEGTDTGPAYVWTVYKGAVTADFIWFSGHNSMSAFATTADVTPSAEMVKVQARFDDVATCQTGLSNINNIFAREGAQPGGDQTLVSASACSIRGAADAGAMSDLWSHIGGTLKSMGDSAPLAAYTLQPITSGPDTADVYIFNVNNSVTDWNNFMTGLRGTADGQSLVRHFGAVLDCNMTLFNGRQVLGGDG